MSINVYYHDKVFNVKDLVNKRFDIVNNNDNSIYSFVKRLHLERIYYTYFIDHSCEEVLDGFVFFD